jgi:iron-sulfur cluster repair protein YtfE (RIC family)
MRLAHEARRVASAHAYLDALETTTRRALEHGALDEMRQALRAFAGSLEAHFALEEQVQFPALHGLDHAFGPELTELERDHERFRGDLADLASLQERTDPNGDRAPLLERFAQLGSELQRHEDREEALLARAPSV